MERTLRKKIGVVPEKFVDLRALTHSQAVHHYRRNPDIIEKGMEIIAVGRKIFHAKTDLIGRDEHGTICMMNVVNQKNSSIKADQLRRYADKIQWITEKLIQTPVRIRLIVLEPGKEPKEVT